MLLRPVSDPPKCINPVKGSLRVKVCALGSKYSELSTRRFLVLKGSHAQVDSEL